MLFLGLFLLLVLGACGKKGPVRPLQEKSPRAVESAQILQRGEGFQIRWEMPQRNQDNSRLEDLDEILIERIFSAPQDFCAECPTPWPLIARIQPQLPRPAQRIRNLFLLSDQGAQAGQVAHYRLTARNKEGALGTPLLLQQPYLPAAAAPVEVRVTPHDQSLELHWRSADQPEGGVLLGYQVYRRSGSAPFSPLPTNLHPLDKPEFSDFGLENGRTYFYRIRSLYDFAGQRLESLPSPEVSGVPAAG
jgi:hypothetical protein